MRTAGWTGIVWVVFMLTAAVASAKPGKWGGGPGGPGGGPPDPAELIERHAEKLGIDSGTLDAIGAVVDEGRPEGRKLRRELRRLKGKLRDLMGEESPSESRVMTLVEEIGAQETQVRKHEVGVMLKIQKLLTPEQREGIREMMEEHREKRRDGRGPRR